MKKKSSIWLEPGRLHPSAMIDPEQSSGIKKQNIFIMSVCLCGMIHYP